MLKKDLVSAQNPVELQSVATNVAEAASTHQAQLAQPQTGPYPNGANL